MVYNARYDILAANAAYRGVFPTTASARGPSRNILWQLFTMPPCCCTIVNRDEEFPALVAQLRAAYGRHVGEPAWESLIGRLSRTSADFARLWEAGDVSPPGNRMKVIRHASVGEIRLVSTSLAVGGVPETRIVVYTPADEESRELTAVLRGIHDPLTGCPEHLRPASRPARSWSRSGSSAAARTRSPDHGARPGREPAEHRDPAPPENPHHQRNP